MSPGPGEFQLYEVEYSERVRERLLKLADVARRRGDGAQFVAAVREIHRRLAIYPQFGEPLVDLLLEPGQTWIGIVRPLSVRYGVFDDRRTVVVAAEPVLLPMSSSDSPE